MKVLCGEGVHAWLMDSIPWCNRLLPFSGPSLTDCLDSINVTTLLQVKAALLLSPWSPDSAGQHHSLASGSRLWRRIQSLNATNVSSSSGPSSSS